MLNEKIRLLDRLIGLLCAERNETPPALTDERKHDCFRALVNVRPPEPASAELLALQDEYLSILLKERGAVDAAGLDYKEGMTVWRGDITRLKADAIVNACNASLLGCFQPLHNCIDNAIHTYAGIQARLDCDKLMGGGREPNGRVKVTAGYNLPARFIFHTVGPIVYGGVTDENRADLKNCYLSCLDRAAELGLDTVAFCCISTGVFGYPQDEACSLAVDTVRGWKTKTRSLRVVFDVFSDADEAYYREKLNEKCGGA